MPATGAVVEYEILFFPELLHLTACYSTVLYNSHETLVPVAILSTVVAVLSRRERYWPRLPHLSKLIFTLCKRSRQASFVWAVLAIALHHFVVARGRSWFPEAR